MKLIGITGYAGHGKDTVGQILVQEFGFRRAAFADKVKEAALAIDPYIGQIVIESGKPTMPRLSALVATLGWDKAKLCPDVRRLLQRIGTDMGREVIGQNIWVDALFDELTVAWLNERIETPIRYAITDVRFPNEVSEIFRRGGHMWLVTRPDYANGVDTTHPSEAHIGQLAIDHTIVNSGSIDDLRAKVRELMEQEE